MRNFQRKVVGVEKLLAAVLVILSVTILLGGCGKSLTDVEYIAQAKEYQKTGDYHSSIISLKNALQQNADNMEARLLLGELYTEMDEGVSAEKELRRAIQLGADEASIAVPLAKALLLQNKWDALLAINADISQLENNDRAELHVLRGRAYLGKGQITEADSEFQAALAADDQSVAAWFGQALLAYEKQQREEATHWLKKVLNVEPVLAEAYALQGDIAFTQHDYQAAEQAYQRAVEAKPQQLFFRVALANAQINIGELDKAIANLNKVLKQYPKHPPSNYLAALVAYRNQNFENAKFRAERVLEMESAHLPARLLAGYAAYRLGQYNQANNHLQHFTTEAPDYDPALKLYAATQLQLGAVGEAAATLQSVALPAEQDAELFAAVGRAALLGGDPRSGRELFEKAVGFGLQGQAAALFLRPDPSFPLVMDRIYRFYGLASMSSAL